MRKEYDFSNAKRAHEVPHLAKLQAENTGKTRITIFLDGDILESMGSESMGSDSINYNKMETLIMPVISMFYGIIIRMYLLDNKHHNLPHIHAKYAEFEASICIEDGEVLAGQLPRKQLRLVQAWIELHRDELMADWELAISNESPYKIAPL